MRIASKRLAKELSDLRSGALPTGCTILQADDLQTWIFQIETLGETVFKGERFALRFRFDDQYPIESPEVVFVVSDGWKAPEASHVYSNGHLCLSILGDEWSPVMSVSSVLLSIQSMLASQKQKERPPDNDRYMKHAPLSPKDSRFVYHDDTI
ncbi:UBC-like protein [Jaminaea rosea]|uniref:UBC-like protein n=1 Tax=Jaminaea rosea TaxID=1569628 RepID=A0A316UK36_9BASI|nr:UBC-like protein [Jaminaea rosea]PWN25662.1 UBC-like protein [Jaminaea rosea]